MFPRLPRMFPNAEWAKPEDIFRFNNAYKSNGNLYLQRLSPEDQWVQEELHYYEDSFCQEEALSFSITTFNVGCKKPQPPLNDLVNLGDGKPTDVIVMAFQEVDMSASAMLKEETEAAAPWVAACNAAVGADMDASPSSPMPYYALKPKQLVGLLLCVYIRRGLLPQLKEFLVTTIATGALGSLGNKGAVGIHLSVHRSTYCIITAHLAAGQSNVSKRNEDINTILKNMDFNAARRADLQLNSSAGIVPEMVFPELFPRDHDFIIVAGDLNY
ncbi:inositol phosphatidylinositol phosphatase, partial [Angomonas deanei]